MGKQCLDVFLFLSQGAPALDIAKALSAFSHVSYLIYRKQPNFSKNLVTRITIA